MKIAAPDKNSFFNGQQVSETSCHVNWSISNPLVLEKLT